MFGELLAFQTTTVMHHMNAELSVGMNSTYVAKLQVGMNLI